MTALTLKRKINTLCTRTLFGHSRCSINYGMRTLSQSHFLRAPLKQAPSNPKVVTQTLRVLAHEKRGCVADLTAGVPGKERVYEGRGAVGR